MALLIAQIHAGIERSPKYRRRFGGRRDSVADFSTISDEQTDNANAQKSADTRGRWRNSVSMNNLAAAAENADNPTPFSFLITDGQNSSVRLHVRACSARERLVLRVTVAFLMRMPRKASPSVNSFIV